VTRKKKSAAKVPTYKVQFVTIGFNAERNRIEPLEAGTMTEKEILEFNAKIKSRKPFLPLHVRKAK